MKLSVLMITYNHEPFVEQAIDSVLMQQVSFDYEIVIGEDCSRDRTPEIVRRYEAAHPGRVRVLWPAHNLGVNRNFIETLRACRGEYVALLEGDDFWLSPHKLQRQVDFLDAHPDCALCAHEAYDQAPDGGRRPYVRLSGIAIKPFYAFDDILQRHFLPTASMVFRRRLLQDPPPELAEIPGVDWLVHVILARQGTVAFIDETWSVRRVHAGGLTSLTPTQAKIRHTIRSATLIDRYLEGAHREALRPTVLAGLVSLVADGAFTDPEHVAVVRKLERALEPYVADYAVTPAERGRILQRAMAHLIVLYYQCEDLARARACWFASIRTGNGTALRRRDFWSIGLTVLLGPSLAEAMRRLGRALAGRTR
ncbi:MAG: glycosyltransferase [Lentisphaerae bacterium]|nr:glycosyltransferase [Lentisphaerota bacterium]